MYNIILSSYKGRPVFEIHRDGKRVLGFGKAKAQAIVECARNPETLKQLEMFSGHRAGDIQASQATAEAADRNRYDAAYCAAGMGEEVAQ